MKKMYSKIAISFAVIAFMAFSCTLAFANERMQTAQFSAYIGPVINLSVADAGGLHSALGDINPTPNSDTIYASVQGMEGDQDILWGINGRYYFGSYTIDIGIDVDLSFSSIDFPASQPDLVIEGMSKAAIIEAESDSDIISLAIGPIFRYQGSGIFDKFHPYISPSISFHYGRANKTNLYPFIAGGYPIPTAMYPQYGQFGSSTITGIGYGLKAGGEYFINDNFGFFIEFRYTQSDLIIDNFRSMKNGLDMTIHTSSMIIGTTWCF
jgi:hypothetical protein